VIGIPLIHIRHIAIGKWTSLRSRNGTITVSRLQTIQTTSLTFCFRALSISELIIHVFI
jgi:hypothetical protein